ncbi:MAG TPA: glycosyltransferase family 39 protein [Chitinispirillaceae bacterium]|nr:glycosyltransferase family 39 protein [Chitinispirillaceae bacterium]
MLCLTLNNTYPLQGDESYYSVSASWMVTNNNYLVPHYFGEPRFQKPILTYLIVAASYKLFGISLWSTRVPIVIFSILTLLLLYRFARLYINEGEFGLFSVMILSSSALFISFSRIAMTDLILTFFSTLALYFFALALRKKNKTTPLYLLAFGATGFAFLAKGPAGFLVLLCYILYLSIIRPDNWKKHLLNLINPLNILLLLAICLPWYLSVWHSNAPGMIRHVKSESTQFTSLPFIHIPRHLLFYTGILILFFLPFSSIATWKYFRKKCSINKELWLPLMMGITYLALFIFFVTAGKDRYLLPAFPSLAIIIAWILYQTGPVRKFSITAAIISAGILLVMVIYPVFTGEALRSCVYEWKNERSESLAIYNLKTLQKGWTLVMAGGKAKVDSYDADYVITDQSGRDSLPQFDVVYKGFEREELRFIKNRPVIKGHHFYLLKRNENQ